jgi:hypothetical protein
MARFSNSTLVALGGVERNVIIDEILYGETRSYDMTWLADTQRTVSVVTGNVITFSPANASVFTLNGFVSFGNNSTLYKIIAISDNNKLTLETTPIVPISTGTAIQIPIDITSADFKFRLLEHTADINDDTRAGMDISNIVPKTGAVEKNLDSNILLTVPGFDSTLGQMRIIIRENDLIDSIPVVDSTQPPLFIGYISILLPATDPVSPRALKKQRVAIICRSDGVIS